MNNVGVSSFAKLAEYITDPQNKRERVAYTAVANCHSDNPEVAMLEIVNTQQLNRRAASDKTYHLIVSFRPGEQPTRDVMAQVEERIAGALGYAEHQRISAAHFDTDNVHIHLAINKIHPTRRTLHAPHQDYKILADVCQQIEAEFGLQADNHQARKRGAENRAADLEHHTGVESLLSWIKRECLADIQKATSWQELHDTLQASGLQMQPRGAGLVITSGDGIAIRASTVSRDLSKSKLEAMLGAFEPATGNAAPIRHYEPRPRSRNNTVELYARYQAERRDTTAKADALRIARAERDRAIDAAKRSARLKRAAARLVRGSRTSKKLLYGQLSEGLREALRATREQHKTRIENIHKQYQRLTWADWLKRLALTGDQAALAALRDRVEAQGLQGATVASDEATPARRLALPVDNITKTGTIIYRAGKATIRDDGARLQVSKAAQGLDALQAVLRIAIARYGNTLAVAGSDDFKERVARAAVASGLPITFSNQALEQRRQQLLKEVHHVRPARTGRPVRATQRVGSRSAANRNGDGPSSTIAERRERPAKPNIGAVGRVPPPEAKHHLRNLSQLGLVRIASGTEVLLPRDVPGHLEQQGTQRPTPVRWHLFGPRPVRAEEAAAADKYIAERLEKKAQGFDIKNHARYNDGIGILSYAGLRHVDNCSLALLQRGDTTLVLPVDPQTASRLQRLALGEPVTVTPRGTLNTGKGLRR